MLAVLMYVRIINTPREADTYLVRGYQDGGRKRWEAISIRILPIYLVVQKLCGAAIIPGQKGGKAA